MPTMTLIETLPADWLNTDKFGEAWDDLDLSDAWETLFVRWLYRNHPKLTLCGSEIIGPVGYDCGDSDSLYEDFEAAYATTWDEEFKAILDNPTD